MSDDYEFPEEEKAPKLPEPKQFREIDKNIEEFKKNVEILPTGLESLDAFLDGGFFKKEFEVLGAPTGKGKSLIAGQIFRNIAMRGFKCAYISLEIANEMIVSRLIGHGANISPTHIMIKMLDEHQEKTKKKVVNKLAAYEQFMYFYDNVSTLAQIQAVIRKGGYDFVAIDFLQNIMIPKTEEYERLSIIALSLQTLAKEVNCCILGVSQLSNQMARDRKSDIVEYKGSGAIGHAADLGLFIEKTSEASMISIRVRKNRRGISGQAFLFTLTSPGGQLIAI